MQQQAELKVALGLPPGPLRLGDACPASVTVRNAGTASVIVNTRLAVGYRNSTSRELFADLLRQDDGAPADVMVVDYQRELPPRSAYRALAPGDTISTRFDLFEWYAPIEPGDYRVVMHYQADEPLAAPPVGTAARVHASAPVLLQVLARA